MVWPSSIQDEGRTGGRASSERGPLCCGERDTRLLEAHVSLGWGLCGCRRTEEQELGQPGRRQPCWVQLSPLPASHNLLVACAWTPTLCHPPLAGMSCSPEGRGGAGRSLRPAPGLSACGPSCTEHPGAPAFQARCSPTRLPPLQAGSNLCPVEPAHIPPRSPESKTGPGTLCGTQRLVFPGAAGEISVLFPGSLPLLLAGGHLCPLLGPRLSGMGTPSCPGGLGPSSALPASAGPPVSPVRMELP